MPPFALPAAQAVAAPAGPDEVVVTARRRKCEIAIADRIVQDREFRARAADWARGTPVRVTMGSAASYRCLAKIVFRLGDYGVTRVVFDPPSALSTPPR